ncbi:unnamed protein product [Rotaria magnacalcarata]|uniref:Uncharacterized protein n=1 Tax=Rotaria magnacalcarata TaxID=392030 RepID=A0A816RTS4_9BILA|nr:unnamed protein product [Rotaria magnacalcarata]
MLKALHERSATVELVNDETSTINEKPAKKIVGNGKIFLFSNYFPYLFSQRTEHEHGSPNFDDDPRIKKIHVP